MENSSRIELAGKIDGTNTTTQLAKMSIDLKFVELTADVLDFFL